MYLTVEQKVLFKSADGVERLRVGGDKEGGFQAGMRRYGTSKFCLIMFMYELQRRLSSDPALSKISIMAMDPGAVGGTDLYKPMPWLMRIILSYIIVPLQWVLVYFFPNGQLRTASKVGRDLLFACFDEKIIGKHPGAVYLDGTRVSMTSVESKDQKKQMALWEGSLKLAGIKEGDTALKCWV